MRSMLCDRKTPRATSGQAAHLTCEAKFDRLNYAALARTIRTRDGDDTALKVDVELSDTADFLDVSIFKLDHFTSPSDAAEKTFAKSSAFGLLFSASSFLSSFTFDASTCSDSPSLARNLSTICW